MRTPIKRSPVPLARSARILNYQALSKTLLISSPLPESRHAILACDCRDRSCSHDARCRADEARVLAFECRCRGWQDDQSAPGVQWYGMHGQQRVAGPVVEGSAG